MKKRKSSNGDVQKIMVGRAEGAGMYGTSAGYLANLFCRGRGPRAYRVGRKIVYKISDLEEFFTSTPVHTIDSLKK